MAGGRVAFRVKIIMVCLFVAARASVTSRPTSVIGKGG
jgi:hypothetical protein